MQTYFDEIRATLITIELAAENNAFCLNQEKVRNAYLEEENKRLRAAIMSAFEEGFYSPTTYNDHLTNTVEDAWDNSTAFDSYNYANIQ